MASDKSHAELIASLREWCEEHQGDIVQYNVIKYALNDLETAHNRECLELAEHSLRCGDCARFGRDCDAGDVDGREDCLPCKKFVREVGVAKMETTTGNAAKMREALEAARSFVVNLEIEPFSHLDEVASDLRAKIDVALSAPPRNCDVGTPEEQYERFRNLCFAKGYSDTDKANTVTEGAFQWAQMPYEAKESEAAE